MSLKRQESFRKLGQLLLVLALRIPAGRSSRHQHPAAGEQPNVARLLQARRLMPSLIMG